VCGYSAKQIRAAYGLTSANTGKAKTIAIMQVGAPNDMFQTLTDYSRHNGLPARRPAQYREKVIGQDADNRKCVNGALGEAALDSEAAYAMAPRASQLTVDGDDCDTRHDGAQAQFNALLAPLTGHGSSASAAIESSSYGLNYLRRAELPEGVVPSTLSRRRDGRAGSDAFHDTLRVRSSDPRVDRVIYQPGDTDINNTSRPASWSPSVTRRIPAAPPDNCPPRTTR
jgi:hypothetical protein